MERHRRYTGVMGKVVTVVTMGYALYCLLYLGGVFHRIGIYVYGVTHTALVLSFVLLFAFLNIPAHKGAPRDRLPWYDVLFIILSLVGTLYIAIAAQKIALEERAITPFQQTLCVITTAMLLEAVRRAVSPILTVLGALFFVYPMFADKAPGFLEQPAWGLDRIATVQYLNPTGIFSSVTYTIATIVVAFIIFGSFFAASGAARVFINVALSVAGRYRGGPAKVAILASALFGSINGSTLANVATTGSVTIPLMKSIGYKPTFAGAVEAVASTGGPVTPPVMGASIFIMMDILGETYVRLMLIALVPCLLFYLGLFIMVDHEAVKAGLKGLPREQVPPLIRTLKDSWFCLVPLVVIVYLLVVLHYSVATSAVIAILSVVVASWLKKDSRMGLKKLGDGLAGSSQGLPQIGTAVAVAGLLMGSFDITGIGLTLAQQLVALAGGNLMLLIMITAVACIIFGMGLTGIAVYILGAIFLAPALIMMGVLPIAAHYFVLWLAHGALITPPVCAAAFLGAAIADAPMMATGWQACRLGVVVYLMSCIWVLKPALLLIGSPEEVALAVLTAIVGVYFVSCGVAGRMLRPASWVQRIPFMVGGTALMIPDLYISLIGLGTVALPALWQVFGARFVRVRVGQPSNPDSSSTG